MLPFSRSIHGTRAAFSKEPCIGPALDPPLDRARRCKRSCMHPSCQGTEVGTGIWSKLVKMCGACTVLGTRGLEFQPKAESNFQRQMLEVLSHAAHYSYSPHAERPNGLRYEGRLLAAELNLA